MIGYVKERVIASAISAACEVLSRKGHTITGKVTVDSGSINPLLEDLPASARQSLEQYIGEGIDIEFTVKVPAKDR